jgi:hypothetical protein
MPKVAKDHEKTLRNYIRQLTIKDPQISTTDIVKIMRKNGIRIGYKYALKLRRKNEKQKVQASQHYTLNRWFGRFVESMDEIERNLWNIATSKKSKPGERIYALSEIRKNHKVTFDTLAEMGVFEKQLGTVAFKTLMEIVKETSEYIDVEATKPKNIGPPETPKALAEEPVGLHLDDVGSRSDHLGGTDEGVPFGGRKQKDDG